MNNYLEVKEIEILDETEASKNSNYPKSGLYLVTTAKTSDLRLIDKSSQFNFMICPASVYYGVLAESPKIEAIPTGELKWHTEIPETGYVSESFVMNFTKLLLQNKKAS